ncbi:hypothetical protein OG948_60045 (plasmid) [Embleya sp. NBC_00888]|uniref:hypothetical protein n=1 Tax=Embleya sp. NBC_00888 TaxID=2975960 RepID=UPI002F90E944|nr:hypothetical protein OG948_60045 [Embleya sp. NBC_00888]
MILPFVREEKYGSVRVTVERVENPSAVGQTAEARDFPCLTALVDFPARGYGALFGWVQLVRSTDGSSAGTEFEMDPFPLFADAGSPYCYFGVTPTLFDSPARHTRDPMTWLAHSFLAWTPMADTIERHAIPLVGFSWGFTIDRTETITVLPTRPLAPSDWTTHLPHLTEQHPTWTFGPPPAPRPTHRRTPGT